MGHQLYRMIRDDAPANWTALMRLVALAPPPLTRPVVTPERQVNDRAPCIPGAGA